MFLKSGKREAPLNKNRLAGNLLIAAGVFLILYFLWLNYSARFYQSLYSMYYEIHEEEMSDDFFTYDDLPGFLKIGQGLLPSDSSPSLDEGPGSAVSGDEQQEEQPETEKQAVLDYVKEVDYTLRVDYVGYDMALVVPRMGVRARVADGTDTASLKKAPGLYESSALPGQGNVLIAAHRDVYGAWFYNIDKVKEGDKLKIYFGDKIYVYDYLDTNIVEKNDWTLLEEEKEQQMLILTSCHPLGTSRNRIIVRAVLSEIIDR